MAPPGFGRNYLIAAGGQAAQAAVGVFTIALLARLLGPADYGASILLTTTVVIATTVLISGLQAATLVIGAKDSSRLAQIHGLIAGSSGLIAVFAAAVTALAGPAIAASLSPSITTAAVGASLLRIPLASYAGLVGTTLAARGRIGQMTLLTVITAVGGLSTVAGATYRADPLTGSVVGGLTGSLLAALLAAALARRTLGGPSRPSLSLVSATAKLAAPMQVGVVGYWILLRGDAFVVNAALGATAVGIYGLALTMSEKLGLVMAPLYSATAWRVSGSDRDQALATTLSLARLEFVLGAAALGLTWLFGPLVVQVMGGPGYEEAVGPLAILALGAAILPLWSTIGLFLVSQLGQAWRTAALQVSVAILTLIAYVLVVPRFGVIGAAATSTVGYVTLVAAGVYFIKRAADFPLLTAPWAPSVRRDPAKRRHP